MKWVQSISLLFENCDIIRDIKEENIINISLNEITTVIQRVACNMIGSYQVVNNLFIVLSKEANVKHLELGCEFYETTTFDRIIRSQDITSIIIKLSDNTENTYYVNCDDFPDDSYNLNQNVKILEDGSLLIVISKNETTDSVCKKSK